MTWEGKLTPMCMDVTFPIALEKRHLHRDLLTFVASVFRTVQFFIGLFEQYISLWVLNTVNAYPPPPIKRKKYSDEGLRKGEY
jgi:hypothetical protein